MLLKQCITLINIITHTRNILNTTKISALRQDNSHLLKIETLQSDLEKIMHGYGKVLETVSEKMFVPLHNWKHGKFQTMTSEAHRIVDAIVIDPTVNTNFILLFKNNI